MPDAIPSPSVRIEVGDKTYTAKLSELTGIDARDFRAVTGFSLLAAIARDDVDMDVGGGIVWLIRRRTEPRLTYESVLDSMNYENYFADTRSPAPNGASPAEPDEGVDPET